MSEAVFCAIDAGGSGTRVRYIRSGNRYKRSMVSRLRKIETSAVLNDIEDKTDDFQILTDNIPNTIGRYVRGSAGNDYRGGIPIQPDNQGLKVNQTVTYINILHMIAKVVLPLKTTETVDVVLGLVIPASEFCSEHNLAARPKELLTKGVHSVHFPTMNKTVHFRIKPEDIYVSGEGMVVALKMQSNPKYGPLFKSADGLIIDVGRRSTDITPFKKGRPVKKAARSFPIGGMQVEANVSSDLEAIEKPVSNDDIINVIAEGKVQDFEVSNYIAKAKKQLAGTLIESIAQTMSQAESSLKNQSYVIMIGQLFKPDSNQLAPNYLEEEILKSFASNVTVVPVEDQEYANCDAMLDIVLKVRS